MTKFHVGCGAFSIYAGTLNKDGTKWQNKNDVKDEAMSAVAQYLLAQDESMVFCYNGKKYRLKVVEEEGEEK